MSNAEYCLFWIDSWLTCSTKGEWAAWIGAAVTVIAGLLVVRWQYRKQQQGAREAERQRVTELIEVLRLALGWIETVRVGPPNPSDPWGEAEVRFFGKRANALCDVLAMLSETEPREIPTVDLRLMVRRAREAIQSVADWCASMERHAAQGRRPSDPELLAFRNRVSNDEGRVATAQKRLVDHLEGRGPG